MTYCMAKIWGANINSASELIEFPWEKDIRDRHIPTEEEEADLLADLNAFNAANQKAED